MTAPTPGARAAAARREAEQTEEAWLGIRDERRRAGLKSLAGLLVAAALPGCGGGGGGGSSAPRAVALDFRFRLTALAPGRTFTLQPVATYADGSSLFPTVQSVWASSNPAVATVDAFGNVVALTPGSTTITASFEGVTASLPLQVGSILQTLALAAIPFRLALGLGGSFRLGAEANYTDRTIDATGQAQWTSSNPAVVASAGAGVVSGVAEGTATVTASMGGLASSAPVRVLGHRRIAGFGNDVTSLTRDLALSASGRALAVWSRGFVADGRADLSWSRLEPGQGWSAPAALRPALSNSFSNLFGVCMHADESGVAVWLQPGGLHAARCTPTGVWSAPVAVDDTLPFDYYQGRSAVRMDSAGNVMAVWAPFGRNPPVKFSRMDAVSGVWSAPAEIEGTGGWQFCHLSFNASGDGVLVGFFMAELPSGPPSSIRIVRWQASTGAGAWQAEELVTTASMAPTPVDAALDDDGVVTVGWIAPSSGGGGVPGSAERSVLVRRRLRGGGWQDVQTVLAGSLRQLNSIAVGAAAGRGAGVAWVNGFDETISAAIMDSGGTWGAPADVVHPGDPAAIVGTPSALHAAMLPDGRFIVSELNSDFAVTGEWGTRIFQPGAGWQPGRRHEHVGRIGNVTGFSRVISAAGEASLLWEESNQGGSDLFAVTRIVL